MVHWEDLEGSGGEGGGRGDRDGEHMSTHGCFISMYDKIHYNKNNNNNFKKIKWQKKKKKEVIGSFARTALLRGEARTALLRGETASVD